MKLEVIAHIENDFDTKFGLPRQSGLNPALLSRVVFEGAYTNPDLLRGMDEFSHLWLIWGFSKADYRGPTVRPPRLGGNERKGVFATRTPFRPNPLGLTVVKLEKIIPGGLIVSGADMMNMTPIYDIKPYIPYADSVPDACGSFAQQHMNDRVEVVFPEALKTQLPEDKLPALIEALSEDPRPAYQDDPGRIYGFAYAGRDVRFRVENGTLTVTDIIKGDDLK